MVVVCAGARLRCRCACACACGWTDGFGQRPSVNGQWPMGRGAVARSGAVLAVEPLSGGGGAAADAGWCSCDGRTAG